MIITIPWLKKFRACELQIEKFKQTFGYAAAININNLIIANAVGLNLFWLLRALCTEDQWNEFNSKNRDMYVEYINSRWNATGRCVEWISRGNKNPTYDIGEARDTLLWFARITNDICAAEDTERLELKIRTFREAGLISTHPVRETMLLFIYKIVFNKWTVTSLEKTEV